MSSCSDSKSCPDQHDQGPCIGFHGLNLEGITPSHVDGVGKYEVSKKEGKGIDRNRIKEPLLNKSVGVRPYELDWLPFHHLLDSAEVLVIGIEASFPGCRPIFLLVMAKRKGVMLLLFSTSVLSKLEQFSRSISLQTNTAASLACQTNEENLPGF